MARDIVAELRKCAADGWSLWLSADEAAELAARLDDLENVKAEYAELRASLETRSPED